MKRPNGTGSVYRLPNGRWRAAWTLYYYDGLGKTRRRKVATKSGIKTKREALEALEALKHAGKPQEATDTFRQVYEAWKPTHERRVSKSTMEGYAAAYNHFAPLQGRQFSQLRTPDFQACVDACPKGIRTKENMQALVGQLSKYAVMQDIALKSYAPFIYVEPRDTKERQVFTADEIEVIKASAAAIPYAGHILALIYTGFRPSELLALTKVSYDTDLRLFTGGSKTAAGKNRLVPVSPVIQGIVDERMQTPGNYVFGDDKGEQIPLDRFRGKCYFPALATMGLRPLAVYCCRHTFATLMKNVVAPLTDKQKLMGHASFEMTAHYTHTDIVSLRAVIDRLA